jgi:lysozyme
MNAPALEEALTVAAALCKHFEGFRSRPYICPAGYPTIGYGTVFKPDGARVSMDDPPISREQAEAWLLSELRSNYGAGVLRSSPNLIKHPKVLAAAIDFAYNLGVSRYRASTLRKRLEAEDWGGARQQLMRWTKAGGRELPGLVRRRKAEAGLLP